MPSLPTQQLRGCLPGQDWQLDFTRKTTHKRCKYLLTLVDTLLGGPSPSRYTQKGFCATQALTGTSKTLITLPLCCWLHHRIKRQSPQFLITIWSDSLLGMPWPSAPPAPSSLCIKLQVTLRKLGPTIFLKTCTFWEACGNACCFCDLLGSRLER